MASLLVGMTITITDAEGSIEEIVRQVGAQIMMDKGERLKPITTAQGAGLLDITMNAFASLHLPKIDLPRNGGVIRYRLSDLKAAIEERTIRSLKRPASRRTRSYPILSQG